jgi:Cu-Zn family superoxide dismutase
MLNKVKVSVLLCILACGTTSVAADQYGAAAAKIDPRSGSKVEGLAIFGGAADGTHVRFGLRGLTPGKHGVHIHETADCSATDASSAGGHYNATHSKHGAPDGSPSHAGDLGNVVANSAGLVGGGDVFSKDATASEILIHIPVKDLFGHSIVIDEKEDDLKTDPNGNSGAHVGCGEIGGYPGLPW